MTQPAASSRTIRFGVVRLGTAGSAILPLIARNPSFTLVAAADRDDETLARLKSDFPNARTFNSAEALAAESDAEAVFIATPTQFHTPHVLAALNAGKHVVSEKPIATTLADAASMIKAAERNGVLLMVGHSFSYETPIREMRKIVKSGELGPLRTAVYSGYDHFHSAELTFGVSEGGTDADLASYGRARAALTAAGPGGEAELKCGFRYGGARARSRDPAPHQPFFGLIIASCEMGDIRQSPEGLLVYGPDEKRDVPLVKGITGRDSILTELHAAMVEGKPPIHDGRWGMANLEVCLAVLESARDHKEVYLSHQKAVND